MPLTDKHILTEKGTSENLISTILLLERQNLFLVILCSTTIITDNAVHVWVQFATWEKMKKSERLDSFSPLFVYSCEKSLNASVLSRSKPNSKRPWLIYTSIRLTCEIAIKKLKSNHICTCGQRIGRTVHHNQSWLRRMVLQQLLLHRQQLFKKLLTVLIFITMCI